MEQFLLGGVFVVQEVEHDDVVELTTERLNFTDKIGASDFSARRDQGIRFGMRRASVRVASWSM